jgi:DNA replication and repair protein RecF
MEESYMIIKKLHLKHFRNYDELAIDFNKNINIFVGNNAQGKTNILESIYVLAITKSHRINLDTNLIKKDCECAKINGIIKKHDQSNEDELEVLINLKGKKVSINKKPVRKMSDYISNFNVIIFHPDDLEILKGSPSERRKFINVELSQLDNHYLAILNNYNQILKNRNEYLKRISIDNYDKSYLEILTNQLINNAIKIYGYRQKFIDDINTAIMKVNDRIKGLENIQIKYETSIPLDNLNDIQKVLTDKYKSTLQREIAMAQTMTGPHRDDFIFFVNGKNARDFGSQGQQRMSVLSLKLAEIELFKDKKGEYPVLLLDDVFSELDNVKRHNIIKYLNKRMQIIITTTDINDVEKLILKNASIFSVDKAVVKQIKHNGNIEVNKNGRK